MKHTFKSPNRDLDVISPGGGKMSHLLAKEVDWKATNVISTEWEQIHSKTARCPGKRTGSFF